MPCRKYFILFYIVSFYIFHKCYYYLRTAGFVSHLNKQKSRSPIIQIATANMWTCRKLLLGECRKCWLLLRSLVWFVKTNRERLCWNFGNHRHLWGQRRSKIYKMGFCCSLLYQVNVVKLFCKKLICRNDSD